MDINEKVDKYVRLRDKIKAIEDKHKAELKPFKEALETLGNQLLDHLNQNHSDRVGTGSGTVYRTAKKSATIADKAVFWDYVVANEQWDLIDYKANSTAVEEHIEENKAPPPGVNFSTTQVVGVRRS